MEILFELLFDIILEGSFEVGTSRKVPMPLRILALLVFFGICGGILAVLFLAGYVVLQDGKTIGAIILFAIDVALLIGFIYGIKKKIKEKRQKKSSDFTK